MRVVSRDEERRYPKEPSQPLFDFASVMIDTGMRPRETSAIHTKDLFLEQGYVYIPEGKAKAAKRRIPLTARAQKILGNRHTVVRSGYLFITAETIAPLTTLKLLMLGPFGAAGFRIFVYMIYDTLSLPGFSNQAEIL